MDNDSENKNIIVDGITVDKDEYVKNLQNDLIEKQRREKELRNIITQYIKSHIQKQPCLAGLDINTQYRQLSWTLDQRGEQILKALGANHAISRRPSENSALTHYIRAFVCAKLNIDCETLINNYDFNTITCLAFEGNSTDHILDSRIVLWRKIVDMIGQKPLNYDKSRLSFVQIVYERIDKIEQGINEILKILKRKEQ